MDPLINSVSSGTFLLLFPLTKRFSFGLKTDQMLHFISLFLGSGCGPTCEYGGSDQCYEDSLKCDGIYLCDDDSDESEENECSASE